MARKGTPSERLTPSNIEKVIGLLSAEKPITKKAACEILGITYNTTRLQSTIDSYLEKKKSDAEKYAKKKGTPATTAEIQYILAEYLTGNSITKIGESIHRSSVFVKNVLTKCGCPIREQHSSYFDPPLIPEESIKEEYAIGEKCYAVRYKSLATVRGMVESKGNIVYSLWLEAEEWQQFAYQPWWELARLDLIIKQYGVIL
jgi:hypothetical protein